MLHALIIGDNLLLGNSIQARLEALGYRSFDRSWTEAEAVAAAANRPPDLIVIGDAIPGGAAVDAARRITAVRLVPVLMMTTNSARPGESLRAGERVEGPYPATRLGKALRRARQVKPG